MDFKKKAGLALALAAIFTTGGANLALADNVTDPAKLTPGNNLVVGGDTITVPTGGLTLVGGSTAYFEAGTTEGVITNTSKTTKLSGDDVSRDAATLKAIDLKITGGDVVIADLKHSKTLTLDDVVTAEVTGNSTINALVANSTSTVIDILGDSSKNQTTTLTVGKLNTTAAIKINVGDTDGAGQLTVTGTGANSATLTGSLIFADPAWVDGAPDGDPVQLNGASTVVIKEFVGDKIDGKLAAGQRSFFSVGYDGDDDGIEWMKTIISETGRWGKTDITAAFGLYKTHTLLDAGSILVDGRYDGVTTNFTGTDAATAAAVKNVTLGNHSLYVANLGTGTGASVLYG